MVRWGWNGGDSRDTAKILVGDGIIRLVTAFQNLFIDLNGLGEFHQKYSRKLCPQSGFLLTRVCFKIYTQMFHNSDKEG